MKRAAIGLGFLLFSTPAYALDKQGSAHGGDVSGKDSGFDVEGSLSMGVSLYNPTYAARPDNTGRTLMRYAGHADVDLVGRKLSIPIDVNMFTDRLRHGAEVFVPTELDGIVGVTSTYDVGPGALELGTRFEHDQQVGPNLVEEPGTCHHGGICSQSYVDARARYLYSLSAIAPGVGRALQKGDVSGWFTLGWFVWNPSYAARPDNSGNALLRYVIHTEVSFFDDLFSIGFDATMFTDRHTSAIKPSELDYTPELIVHLSPFEVHLAYEQDLPLDKNASDESEVAQGMRGLRQRFVYLLGAWNFDLVHEKTKPMEERGHIVSP